MSKRVVVLFAAIMLSVTSAMAQEKDVQDKKIEKILGTWKIQKVLSGNTEVAKNPTSGQWIEFKNNGRYVNHTASVDSGSFRLNENHSTLYLESQVQPDAAKIEEWTIALTDNTLTMESSKGKGKKSSNKDKMKYVYVRIEKGSNKLNN